MELKLSGYYYKSGRPFDYNNAKLIIKAKTKRVPSRYVLEPTITGGLARLPRHVCWHSRRLRYCCCCFPAAFPGILGRNANFRTVWEFAISQTKRRHATVFNGDHSKFRCHPRATRRALPLQPCLSHARPHGLQEGPCDTKS